MNLKALALAAAPVFLVTEEVEAANIISSPNAMALYGDTFPLIDEMYPDLNAMIVTRDFIPEANDAYYQYDFSFYDMCNWPAMTDEMTAAMDIRLSLEQNMADVFFQHASGDEVFIPKPQLLEATIRDHTTIQTMASNAVSGAIDGYATAITLNHFFPDMTGTVGIITMPDEVLEPYAEASDLSGLDSYYLETTATGNDYSIYILGHEIGHLVNRDGQELEALNDVHYCSSVNIDSIDESVIDESEADIAGAVFFDRAKELGLTSGADLNTEIGHLRSIGTLMIPSNSYVVKSNEDMVGHLTNTGFDPSNENYKEEFNFASLDGISSLPLLINNYADTLAGYAATDTIKQDVRENPDAYTEEDIMFYEELPDSPSTVHENSSQFSWVGYNIRSFESSPTFHYAALKYMDENGHLDDLKDTLKPEYAAAIDDIVEDYFKGIGAVTEEIKDGLDYEIFSEKMDGIDIAAIGKDVKGWAEAYKQDPESYIEFKGVSQSYDPNIFK